MVKPSIGILASHPIQYQAPWFRELAKEFDLHVYFAHRQTSKQQAEAGFGQTFDWDTNLLEGYCYTFLENRSQSPGVDHFLGCDTPQIQQIIRQQNFDLFIVCGWNLKSYWQAVHVCRNLGIPVLARGDSQLNSPRPWYLASLKEIAYRILLGQFNGFLCVGQRNREYLLHYGVAPKRIFDAPHCVDNDWFKRQAKIDNVHRQALRRQLGISPDATLLLFVGKLVPRKYPLDLIQALSLLKNKGIHVEGLFVGSGEMESLIRQRAQNLSLKVHLAGFKNQSELPRYYALADMLVLPSDGSETWGLVANEAMACGLPAVVSRQAGCAADLIDEGKTGATFRFGDAENLAERIQSLLPQLGSEDLSCAIQKKIEKYAPSEAVQGVKKAVDFFDPLSSGRQKLTPSEIRILVIFGNIPLYGQERATIQLFHSLKKEGVSSLLVTHKQWGGLHIQPALNQFQLPWVAATYADRFRKNMSFNERVDNIKKIIVGSWEILKIARDFQPTHIHVVNETYLLVTFPALLCIGKPIVYLVCDLPLRHRPLFRFWWKWILAKVVRRFVCVSRHIQKCVLTAGVKRNKTNVIFLYPPERIPAQKDNNTLPDRYTKGITVTYIGQIAQHKGVDLFVQASLEICQSEKNVRFLIAGDYAWENPFADSLRTRVTQSGYSDRILFLGNMEAIEDLLAMTQIHVCPSIWEEPLPTVVLEAKRAQVPSVVFASGGIPELVIHEEDGFVCSEKTTASLKEGIEYFMKDSVRSSEAGKKARTSLKNLGIDDFSKQWRTLYERT
ncbi:MAG: glycosyltransferase family 4 protein [Candidatus Omnitrophica bacterium]|nr:glycosyltransferase family 4 protein [Candidatus Omnitrophota bacterium]